jgi:beta-phosphoglucomutase
VSVIFKERNFKPKERLNYWIEKWKGGYEKMVDNGEIKPIKGFLEFNKKLNRLKVKKIIATGSHKRNAFILLKSFGIENEFDIVGCEDVKQRKPSPQLFLVAAERLNSEPKDCVVFEDSPVGIRAAKRVGMKCVALTTSTSMEVLEKENPDLIIDDYTEIDVESLLLRL